MSRASRASRGEPRKRGEPRGDWEPPPASGGLTLMAGKRATGGFHTRIATKFEGVSGYPSDTEINPKPRR